MKPLQFISRIPDYVGAIAALYIALAILSNQLLNYQFPYIGKVEILPFIGIILIGILQILLIPKATLNWNSFKNIGMLIGGHLLVFAIAAWYYFENFGINSFLLLFPSLIISFELIKKRPRNTFWLLETEFPSLFKPVIYMLFLLGGALFIILPIHLFLNMIYPVAWLSLMMIDFWNYAYFAIPAAWFMVFAYQLIQVGRGESSDVDLDSLMDERPKLGS